MNKTTKAKLQKAQLRQGRAIRSKPCFKKVEREFSIEYEVAKQVASLRLDANLTQADVAAAMGTTQSVISRIEHGANVSIETLSRYVTACGHQLRIQVI